MSFQWGEEVEGLDFGEETDVNGNKAPEEDRVSVVRELPTFENKLYTLEEVLVVCFNRKKHPIAVTCIGTNKTCFDLTRANMKYTVLTVLADSILTDFCLLLISPRQMAVVILKLSH